MSGRRSSARVISLGALIALISCSTPDRSATLSWSAPVNNADGSPLENLAGYYIYYGRSPQALTQSIQIRDPAATTYVVKSLDHGPYYFSIVAYTAAGAQSGLAAPVLKMIP